MNQNPLGNLAGHENKAGRPVGTQNKFTRSAKEQFLEAFEKMGGVDGLVSWAMASDKNKGLFYSVYGRLIPTEQRIGDPNGKPYNFGLLVPPKAK